VLTGPTASGKTSLAIALCERFGCEVVSADSMQVYRYLDIGTSKPSEAERARARHHLIDVAEPDEHYDAGRFAREADQAISDIRARGLVPLVVGGTGLYLRALVRGLTEVPPVPDDVRAAVRDRLERLGAGALHAELAEVDPALAAQLPPGDTQRIVRGLEVFWGTGLRLSALQEAHRFTERRYDARVVALEVDREALYRRIDARVAAMVAAGLVGEVRAVLDRGFAAARCRALRAPGYKEVAEHIAGELDAAAMIEGIARAHRRYAKRQVTWFRAEEGVAWLSPDDVAGVAHALGLTARDGS
jgi:tRNA dimethylallyltransferase